MNKYAVVTIDKTDEAILELQARLEMDKTIGPNCKLMVTSFHDTREEAEYEYEGTDGITKTYLMKIINHDERT